MSRPLRRLGFPRRFMTSNKLDDLDAVNVGHIKIQEKHVHRREGEALDRFQTAARLIDFNTFEGL